MVSSSLEMPENQLQPPSRAAATANTSVSKLRRMKGKNYNVDWDAGFAAPMSVTVPPTLGGLRLDQALARLFPQYSRNRLQAWLRSGHIKVEGASPDAKHAVAGGERIVLTPPPPPAEVPQAQRMPLKIVHED